MSIKKKTEPAVVDVLQTKSSFHKDRLSKGKRSLIL